MLKQSTVSTEEIELRRGPLKELLKFFKEKRRKKKKGPHDGPLSTCTSKLYRASSIKISGNLFLATFQYLWKRLQFWVPLPVL